MRNALIGLIAFCAVILSVPYFISFGGVLVSGNIPYAGSRSIPEIDAVVPVALEIATFGMG